MLERSSERIEFIDPNGSMKITLFDLSATGVCCLHSKIKQKDEEVSVKLNDLTVRAKVVYCQERTDGYRMGLRFWQVPADKQKALNELTDGFSRGLSIRCTIVD